MTPLEFTSRWSDTDEPLSPISASRLDKFDLLKETFDFLNIAGLPGYCEPHLSFVGDTDDLSFGLCKLTDQYDFLEEEAGYEQYIVIGSCRDGDPIVIDTSNNDCIVELDHGDMFSPKYFNSSIETLADFLIIYRDFKIDVLQDKDSGDPMQIFNFTDGQFENLIERMSEIDNTAVTEDGFWKDELQIMLSIRQDKFPNI